MQSHFTELETERYYDIEDAIYKLFWDKDGSVHWGYFADGAGGNFLAASAYLNELMLAKSGIDQSSHVLDIGCGNGNTAIWMAGKSHCKVTGIDLSGVRVANAVRAVVELDDDLSSRLSFEKASAASLPFEEGLFTHLWSQATIYHVPDKQAVLDEAYRVLARGGTFVFDDLIKPKLDVSQEAQKYVYDRLMFDTQFSFTGYRTALEAHGFEVVEAEDLSSHLKTSYEKLREMATEATDKGLGDLTGLVTAYEHTMTAIEQRELGWALYICRKRND